MNKKIIAIIILIVLIIGGGYFLFNTISSNNSILGVSHFDNEDISFDYPRMWLENSDSDYNFTFQSWIYNVTLDIYDISNTTFEKQADVFLHNDSNPKINYTVIKINEIRFDGQKTYDVTSKFNKNGGFYYRALVFENNNKMYVLAFLSGNPNTVINDFNLIKNSIKLK